jgi:hypothetical protein
LRNNAEKPKRKPNGPWTMATMNMRTVSQNIAGLNTLAHLHIWCPRFIPLLKFYTRSALSLRYSSYLSGAAAGVDWPLNIVPYHSSRHVQTGLTTQVFHLGQLVHEHCLGWPHGPGH